MDVVVLSRIQFAFTVSFHYIYPPLSIGLGVMLVVMEGMLLKTGNKLYETMTRFWIKIFALIYGIGVATGIVMEFEFGTNWATYSKVCRAKGDPDHQGIFRPMNMVKRYSLSHWGAADVAQANKQDFLHRCKLHNAGERNKH